MAKAYNYIGESLPTRAAKDQQLQYQKLTNYSGESLPTTVATAYQTN